MKLVLIFIGTLLAVGVSGQSKELLKQGVIHPSFNEYVFTQAQNVPPLAPEKLDVVYYEPGVSIETFRTELAILYGWAGGKYFTPTQAVSSIARLQYLLSKDRPSFFLVETSPGSLVLVRVFFIKDQWQYSANGMISLISGADLYYLTN